MALSRIHQSKRPRRGHYIAEWMEHRNLKKADIARETGADKGLVGRWVDHNVLPGENYLLQLAELFGTDRDGLFRSPDDDWLFRFFENRSEEERHRARTALEVMFPKNTGTNSN